MTREAVRIVELKAIRTFVSRAVALGVVERPRSRGASHHADVARVEPEPGEDVEVADADATPTATASPWGTRDRRVTSPLDPNEDAALALVERLYVAALERRAEEQEAHAPDLPASAPENAPDLTVRTDQTDACIPHRIEQEETTWIRR